MPRHKPVFATEAALCSAVIERLEAAGWVVYPESCGYDFLAVLDGFSVGVQAKKTANLTLIRQAVEPLGRRRLPSCVIALTETQNPEAAEVCRRLDIVHLGWWGTFQSRGLYGPDRDLDISRFHGAVETGAKWLRHSYPDLWGRVRIPELRIVVPSGVPSPQTSTDWKVRAVKLCLRLRAGETVTRADLASARLAYSTFWKERWIERANTTRPATYRLGSDPRTPPPDLAYPEIVEAIEKAI